MSGAGSPKASANRPGSTGSARWATQPPGAVLAYGGIAPERTSYDHVVLTGRLREAALRINPDRPVTVVEPAMTRLRKHRAATGAVCQLASSARIAYKADRRIPARAATTTQPTWSRLGLYSTALPCRSANTISARVSQPRMALTAVRLAPVSVASRRRAKGRVVAWRACSTGTSTVGTSERAGWPRCTYSS